MSDLQSRAITFNELELDVLLYAVLQCEPDRVGQVQQDESHLMQMAQRIAAADSGKLFRIALESRVGVFVAP